MKTETGCFVYRVLANLGVRFTSSTEEHYKTGRAFSTGDLVSVDLIVVSEADGQLEEGPFLRLSDGSGWLFERKPGNPDRLMERLPVEEGLWCFYIGNGNTGIVPRTHPMDQLQENSQGSVLKQVPENAHILHPMHKAYCDRRVKGKDGVHFYRLQGRDYTAWIFDKRATNTILYPESRVQSGLFAFQSLNNISIRSDAAVGDDFKTLRSINKDDIVVCDIVLDGNNSADGPYVRLTDGTGWLFLNKNGEAIMKETPIEEGEWRLWVNNEVGIILRRQPIDETISRYSDVYAKGELVVCDRMIQSPCDGPTYFRVKGTDGWIFDKRGDHQMATVTASFPQNSMAEEPQGRGWTPDFVRGLAAAALKGAKEISFNLESRVISFRHPEDGARINVYYTTQTVGTALDHPRQGTTQLFRRNCTQDELIEILQNPRVHTGHGYYRNPKRSRTDPTNSARTQSNMHGEDVNMEEDFRHRLKDVEDEMGQLAKKRKTIVDSIRSHEAKRLKHSATMAKHTDRHQEVLNAERQNLLEKKRQEQLEAQRQEQLEAQRKRERTCSHCGREFINSTAVHQHIQDVHSGFTCDYCGKWCKTRGALNQHINATGHW